MYLWYIQVSQYGSGIHGTQENPFGNQNILCTHKGLGALCYNTLS